jgi:Spy/CpxP family protein refolding chaperone
MNKNRLAKAVAVVSGFIFLCAVPELSRAQSAPPTSVQAPKVTSSGAQAKRDSVPADDFAGLDYSEEQKTEIDQIQRHTKALMDAVVKDDKLTADQKDAMLMGYKRIEYGQVYKVLTPQQQKQIRQKIQARRAEKQTAQTR